MKDLLFGIALVGCTVIGLFVILLLIVGAVEGVKWLHRKAGFSFSFTPEQAKFWDNVRWRTEQGTDLFIQICQYGAAIGFVIFWLLVIVGWN